MRKKRLIFTLLYHDGYFMLSRNFRLQKVGELKWIEDKYNFKKIAFSIDELIILSVDREERNEIEFCETVTQLINNVFVPIAVGGGITSYEYAKSLFMSGADKIIINSALTENPELVKRLVRGFGSQAIIASVDFLVEDNKINIYINNGTKKIDYSFKEYLEYVQKLGVGELYLNSMRKDGTGQGFDLEILDPYLNLIKIPVIMAGGAGNAKHLIEAAKNDMIDAVATANLFNFIGNSLPNSRLEMIKEGIHLAQFLPIEF